MKGLVITTTGEVQPFDGAYQELVDAVGGVIECAPCGRDDVTIWCAEEGKLLRYAVNNHANALWFLLGDLGCMAGGDFLVGNVVLLGGTDPSGETLDLPEPIAQAIPAITQPTEN